ncbi:Arf guanine nucleotide exchange factor sec74 [Neolecta irregularis DAH-3]|uniref:Arf guanine nucleotide exchange factor sec74 n=1 Tax=Neolecta irregularis (strain DAH-3) TaxID=1198029 RepID=A0A1U7LLX3_NEOID|nr:Arf guanine nucleotide exchange factor sec74 [Neolecta irregularis DAH-3]|eukprot:OLL23583.1 Arf guanine nucleotide exchange factor sec74 [Neolecta irregularis DAH-3]
MSDHNFRKKSFADLLYPQSRSFSEAPRRNSVAIPGTRQNLADKTFAPRLSFSSCRRNPASVFSHEEKPVPRSSLSNSSILPPYEGREDNPRNSHSSTDSHEQVTTTVTHTTTIVQTIQRFSRQKRKTFSAFFGGSDHENMQPGPSESNNLASVPPASAHSARHSKEMPRQATAIPAASSALVATTMNLSGIPVNRPKSTGSCYSGPATLHPSDPNFKRDRSSTVGSAQSLDSGGSLSKKKASLFGSRRKRENNIPLTTLLPTIHVPPVIIEPEPEERVVLPLRQDEDTPNMYLAKLQEALNNNALASVIARNGDDFSLATLKCYMESFKFSTDPIDMALRKLLMELHLPKETQQIDRVLDAFAQRYHFCNPEQPYILAFSLMMLHTDAFNHHNRQKMTKLDYIRNTRLEGVFPEVLECLYDNITYTPFVHVEDDYDINGNQLVVEKPKRNGFQRHSKSKATKHVVDPYSLLMSGNLESLRPDLAKHLSLEDPFSYKGTLSNFDIEKLHRAFSRAPVLQVVSANSRPQAYANVAFLSHGVIPGYLDDFPPGIVEVKATKVGILLRREDKKKSKAGRAWKEWGAILTGSQLLFFKNTAWVKNLVEQEKRHKRISTASGEHEEPLHFEPPIQSLQSDALLSTQEAVAVYDKTYRKKSNAFIFFGQGNTRDVFLAQNIDDMNDWIHKINYAAAHRSAGIRFRGVVKGRGLKRMSSSGSSVSNFTAKQRDSLEVASARRHIVRQRLEDLNENISVLAPQLDANARNAKNLYVLTPIQQVTRDQVVEHAKALDATLRTVRLEMARLKCHQEGLLLEMAADTVMTPSTSSFRNSVPLVINTQATTPERPVVESSTTPQGNPPLLSDGSSVISKKSRLSPEQARSISGNYSHHNSSGMNVNDEVPHASSHKKRSSFLIHGKKCSVVELPNDFLANPSRIDRETSSANDDSICLGLVEEEQRRQSSSMEADRFVDAEEDLLHCGITGTQK